MWQGMCRVIPLLPQPSNESLRSLSATLARSRVTGAYIPGLDHINAHMQIAKRLSRGEPL